MTMRKTMHDPNAGSAQSSQRLADAVSAVEGDFVSLRRNMSLDQDETIWDYTAIERRAQELRSEAAWNMAQAIREWAVKAFGQGKAKARAAVQAPLERHGQAT